MRYNFGILVDPYYATAHAGGLISVYGYTFSRGDSIVLARVCGDAEIGWGHCYGPLNAMPGQLGKLVQIALSEGGDALTPSDWVATGKEWPLGTSAKDIACDVAGVTRGSVIVNCRPA